MRLNKILILSVCISALAAISAAAQAPQSPYSRYGYGSLGDNATSAQRAMGGVGYAMNSGRQINVMNPASYAAIDSLTFLFDMGVDLNNLWTTEATSAGTNHGKKLGGGLDYVTMQVPVTRWGGASIGLLPFSSVGYSFGDQILNGTQARQGSGGINQLYLGLAARPFKGFSLGANVSYLFGNITHDTYAYTSSGSISLFERVMEVKDYHLDFGVQYSYNIDRRNRITAGVTFSPGKALLGRSIGLMYDTNKDAAPDTVANFSMRRRNSLPDSWGVGLNWQWNDRLMVEADATIQQWSKARYSSIEGFEDNRFVNRYKAALGAQYTPQPRGSYIQRVQYRFGISATRDYWTVQGNTVREYGIHAGFGLPTPTSKTMINIGVEYRHRQAHPNPLVKEQYLLVTLGVNFNELMFWQNKLR